MNYLFIIFANFSIRMVFPIDLKSFVQKTVTCLQICYLKGCECVLGHFYMFGHINAVKCINFSFMVSEFGATFRRALQLAINILPSLEKAQINFPLSF